MHENSEITTLQLALYRPDSLLVHANFQTMTNGNTSYKTDLPGSGKYKHASPSIHPKWKLYTCTVLRLISEVPTHWRALEGTEELMLKRTPSLVRKCVDGVVVSIRYDVTVVRV